MKIRSNQICAAFLILPLLTQLTGCADPNAANSFLGPAIGASAGAIIGHQSGRATEGAAIGALAGFVIQQAYEASQRQKAEAQRAADRYEKSLVAKKNFTRTRADVVAIPVKADKSASSNSKDGVVLYDPRSGSLVDNKVYSSKGGTNAKSGEVVTIGSRKAMVYNGGAI